MKKLRTHILVLLCLIIGGFMAVDIAQAEELWSSNANANLNYNYSSNSVDLDKFEKFDNNSEFYSTSKEGEQGLYNTLLQIAKGIKNIFFLIATIYFMVIIIRLILSDKTEEELSNFKKGIIWITVGIMVMQMSYIFVVALFDQGSSAKLAYSLYETIILPLIELVRTLASFIFIAVAIFAFYRLITANGSEEEAKNGKMTILYAIFGFILVTLAGNIVKAFYGKVDCGAGWNLLSIDGRCNVEQDLSQGIDIVINVLNWVNGFIGIAVILMLIYAWFLTLLSAGDEDKVKKTKSIILFVAIGLFVLATNYLILTFFILPEATI